MRHADDAAAAGGAPGGGASGGATFASPSTAAAADAAEEYAARLLEVERARRAELAAPRRPTSPTSPAGVGGGGGGGRAGSSQRPRRMWRTITAALGLFTIGSVMLWLGTRALGVDSERATALLVLGGLTFLPGSYASWVLLGSWLRWRGYRAEDLPSYDEED